MQALQSLAPFSYFLLAVFLIGWGIITLFRPADRTLRVILAIVALIAGILFFIAH